MKIAISFGAFLPVPPLRGGATEKIWSNYAVRLAARGHEVMAVSRRWPGLPDEELRKGVRHIRLPGRDHYPRLWQNLLLDLRWSLRVRRVLPSDAIVVSHNVSLPWLLTLAPPFHRSPVAVALGRMPKGQVKLYRRVRRVYAMSTAVRDATLAQAPALAAAVRVVPNAIDLATLSGARLESGSSVRIGYIGRLHPEKGLELLAAATRILSTRHHLPRWRLDLVGPSAIAEGGGGQPWLDHLRTTFPPDNARHSVAIHPPVWDPAALAARYRDLDICCYPSLAEQGETFGVSALEAMAAGAVPVLSGLACFRDFARHEENALVFDHRTHDSDSRLADQLDRLIQDSALRTSLATSARHTAGDYDYDTIVAKLEADLATLR